MPFGGVLSYVALDDSHELADRDTCRSTEKSALPCVPHAFYIAAELEGTRIVGCFCSTSVYPVVCIRKHFQIIAIVKIRGSSRMQAQHDQKQPRRQATQKNMARSRSLHPWCTPGSGTISPDLRAYLVSD